MFAHRERFRLPERYLRATLLISYGADMSEGGTEFNADIRTDEMLNQR